MSFVIVRKIETPYKEGEIATPPEKVFICKTCHKVIVDPDKNAHWGEEKTYFCVTVKGGCGKMMICIKSFEEKIEPLATLPAKIDWICHSDFFSVNESGTVFLETDLGRIGRRSLTDFINKKKTTSDDELVEALRKKSHEEMSVIMSRVYSLK